MASQQENQEFWLSLSSQYLTFQDIIRNSQSSSLGREISGGGLVFNCDQSPDCLSVTVEFTVRKFKSACLPHFPILLPTAATLVRNWSQLMFFLGGRVTPHSMQNFLTIPPSMEVWSLNHWTTKEVHNPCF